MTRTLDSWIAGAQALYINKLIEHSPVYLSTMHRGLTQFDERLTSRDTGSILFGLHPANCHHDHFSTGSATGERSFGCPSTVRRCREPVKHYDSITKAASLAINAICITERQCLQTLNNSSTNHQLRADNSYLLHK